MAASLLVPADMLPAAAPVAEPLTDGQHTVAVARPADPEAPSSDGSHPEGAADRNLFLDHEAAGADSGGHTSTPASRWSIAALLTRLKGSRTSPRRSVRPQTRSRTALRRMPVRRARPVAIALASVAAIAVIAVIVTRSGAPISPSSLASGHGGITGALDPFQSVPLAVAANPFAARHPEGRAAPTHVR
jgi:hypothetical protein